MAHPAFVRACTLSRHQNAHLLGLDPFLLGQKLVGHGELRYLSIIAIGIGSRCMYLHGTAQAEDAVVCLLGSEALESLLDDIVLFGDQVIGPAKQLALAQCPITPDAPHLQPVEARAVHRHGDGLLQSHLPVSSSVTVPLGDGLDPAAEPRAGFDEGSEGRSRHGVGAAAWTRGGRGGGLPSIAVCLDSEVVELSGERLES